MVALGEQVEHAVIRLGRACNRDRVNRIQSVDSPIHRAGCDWIDGLVQPAVCLAQRDSISGLGRMENERANGTLF